MLYNPHKFYPTLYASDPYDLLLPITGREPIAGVCACLVETHENHEGKACGANVERYAIASKGYYICADCKISHKRERDRDRKRKIHGN